MSEDERKRLEAQAKAAGLPVAGFIRYKLGWVQVQAGGRQPGAGRPRKGESM